jgi:hypothetical protein
MTYRLPTFAESAAGTQFIYRIESGQIVSTIPCAEGNTDYQAYLAWLAEGNTPEPAPEPEPAPVLTTEQKLEAAGLTVAELKELFGL